MRSFCDDNPHEDGWQNLLVWGDNLMAMRELLEDQRGPNRFGTRDKIKLVYIDPPFATRQDFMKDKEKAYRDKVIGSRFIEFMRRRLIVLRELLADDGAIYVHLDTKKSHYLKACLDEIFGEENFLNEITWQRSTAHNMKTKGWARCNDTIFFYSRSDSFVFNEQHLGYSQKQLSRFKRDENGELYKGENLTFSSVNRNRQFTWRGTTPPANRSWGADLEQLEKWWSEGRILTKQDGTPRLDGLKILLSETRGGTPVTTNWTDIERIGNTSSERENYPTQKPESFLERIIRASSNTGDVVLDCFAGSGTTSAVAEKLGRKWIAIDCGKLAVYTTQKRVFSLNSSIGAIDKDERTTVERTADWSDHEKKARGLFFITEKARKGECDVTLGLLKDLAAIAEKHQLVKSDTPLSIVCPEAKLKIKEDQLYEPQDGPGAKAIEVGGIEFRISFIEPKEKPEKEKPLPAKQFALYRAGIYDMQQIQSLPWEAYRPLVMKLFGVRDAPHKRYGMNMDGTIRGDAALVWNYPDHPKLSLDHDYVESLHKMVRGKAGEKIYVIAPVVAMSFMEDEVTIGKTIYIFLKVPVSVLMRLIEQGEPAALPQPMKEEDVNEVIDAVGFDFVSQPIVEYSVRKSDPTDGLLQSYIIEITEFRAQTFATDPEDFRNFETLSMVLVDLNYDGDVFRLSEVHWGEELVKAAGGLDDAKVLTIEILEDAFAGDRMMVILCDRYGNEKTLSIDKDQFIAPKKRPMKKATTQATKKKASKRKTSGGSR